MPAQPRQDALSMNQIGYAARVFLGQAIIVEVQLARLRIDDHVLQHRPNRRVVA